MRSRSFSAKWRNPFLVFIQLHLSAIAIQRGIFRAESGHSGHLRLSPISIRDRADFALRAPSASLAFSSIFSSPRSRSKTSSVAAEIVDRRRLLFPWQSNNLLLSHFAGRAQSVLLSSEPFGRGDKNERRQKCHIVIISPAKGRQVITESGKLMMDTTTFKK